MDLQGHANYFSCCVTTTTKPMATRHGKVVTYYKKLKSIKLHTLWTRGYVRSCDFTFITWSSDFDFSYTISRFKTQTPKSSPTSCSTSITIISSQKEVSGWNVSGNLFFMGYGFWEGKNSVSALKWLKWSNTNRY